MQLYTATLALLALPLLAGAQGRSFLGLGVIDTPGHYTLNRELSSRSGVDAILITASNVTLDLNGQSVIGPGGKAGTGIRIRGARGVKVMNGHLSNFAFGVIVENSDNVVLTGLQIRGEGLPVTAPPPETGIMIVQSRNVIVTENALFNVGLGVFVRGGRSYGNRIAENTLTGGTNGILGICYNPADGDPMGPRSDFIYGNQIVNFNIGIQFSPTSRANIAKENTIAYRVAAFDIQNDTNIDLDNTTVMFP